MALEAFIPTIWSARMMANLRRRLVFAQPGVVNRDYEGEVRAIGDTVRITALGGVEIGEYQKNTDFVKGPQTLESTSTTLVIDKAPYWNVYVDSIDRAQASMQFLDQAMNEAGYSMAMFMDKYIAGLYTQVGNSRTGTGGGNIIGTDENPVSVGVGTNDVQVYDLLVAMGVALDENDVPDGERYAILPPWCYGLLKRDTRFVGPGAFPSRLVLQNGIIGDIDGLTLLRSNNVVMRSDGGPNQNTQVWKIQVGHPMAITMAQQLAEIRPYSPERRFGEAVKGLNLLGAKVIRPNALCIATVKKGTM